MKKPPKTPCVGKVELVLDEFPSFDEMLKGFSDETEAQELTLEQISAQVASLDKALKEAGYSGKDPFGKSVMVDFMPPYLFQKAVEGKVTGLSVEGPTMKRGEKQFPPGVQSHAIHLHNVKLDPAFLMSMKGEDHPQWKVVTGTAASPASPGPEPVVMSPELHKALLEDLEASVFDPVKIHDLVLSGSLPPDLAKAAAGEQPVLEDDDGILTDKGMDVITKYATAWVTSSVRDLQLERDYPDLTGLFYDVRVDPDLASRYAQTTPSVGDLNVIDLGAGYEAGAVTKSVQAHKEKLDKLLTEAFKMPDFVL